MPDRFFEDIAVGDVTEHGTYDVTEAEIIEFAKRYDPQPFHVDPAAAEASMYGGLIASGWHTSAMTMRLLVDGLLSEVRSLGSPGIDSIRWRVPVRPGDRLAIRTEVLGKEPTNEERGMVDFDMTTLNADGEAVMTMVGRVIVARRPDG